MTAEKLTAEDLGEVLDLFSECFRDDHYYRVLFPDDSTRPELMRKKFGAGIGYCIEHGETVGIRDEGRIVAFALCFYYRKTKEQTETFCNLFGADGGDLPYAEKLHGPIGRLNGETLYLLSIAVAPSRRREGLASCIVDKLLFDHPDLNFASDVSNEKSLPIYEKRGFRVEKIAENYHLILRRAKTAPDPFADSENVPVLLPDPDVLDRYNVPYRPMGKRRVIGYSAERQYGISFFEKCPGALSEGCLVSLRYPDLLKYQRILNVSHYAELLYHGFVLYARERGYVEPPYMNDTLEEMLENRETEWSIVPDIYISIPVQYTDPSLLQEAERDARVDAFLGYMTFRTNYEAGVPSTLERVDDLASLKKRIKRIYLGKKRIRILGEITPDVPDNSLERIGPAVLTDLFVSVDRFSNCAVLTLCSMSSPFLLSHLLDSTIRNQLMVEEEDGMANLFDELKLRYGIIKQGTPKSFVIIPQKNTVLSSSQLASLLSSETIYPDGENFGRITDPEILSVVGDPDGMGQYDRATVYASKNVVLQFEEDLVGSLNYRMGEQSITLFYMEIILFEEAAIHMTDREMINLFTAEDGAEPVNFLKQVNDIYDNYSKTIDFWNLKVNYPTSQKSIAMLRTAFDINGMLEAMKRNQEHLRIVFDTKCDIIDRKDSKRMDTSLAIISVLAIFSALIDSYDYISTWQDVFTGTVIYILQKVFFCLILLTALYVIFRLFVKKRAAKRAEGKRAKKRKDRGNARSSAEDERKFPE